MFLNREHTPMLTDAGIRAAKPAPAPYKISDEKGLLLLVRPTGTKTWKFKYRFPRSGSGRKEKQLTFGSYPEVTLQDARADRDEARRDLRQGIDPAVKRKMGETNRSNTFAAVARELLALLRRGNNEGQRDKRGPISADTIDTMERRLQMHVFPHIGERDVGLMQGSEVLEVLRRIEGRGTYELAHRVRSICSRVFRYGRMTGRNCQDVAADLIGLLVPVEAEHMAAIVEPARVGDLLRSIDGYRGEIVTRLALRLWPHLPARQIEFRHMEWSHLTLDGAHAQWRVPWQRMKMREPHIVPLSRQVVALLCELRQFTGAGRWVLPQLRNPERPMSENCITAALRAMNYSGAQMTAHGVRAMFSTLLAELGWEAQWIEMQLAHAERNKVRAAYNHARYLRQREVMMQFWSDYLDVLRLHSDGATATVLARNLMAAAMRFVYPSCPSYP